MIGSRVDKLRLQSHAVTSVAPARRRRNPEHEVISPITAITSTTRVIGDYLEAPPPHCPVGAEEEASSQSRTMMSNSPSVKRVTTCNR